MSEAIKDVHVLSPPDLLCPKLSDRLSGENLKAMKNLCYDFITGRQRDEVDSGIALFNILIEQSKEVLSGLSTQELCK